MSFKLAGMVWDLDLPSTEKIVLLSIADDANHATGLAFPGHEYTAKKCSLSVATVKRAVKSLITHGYLVSEVRHDDAGRQTSNLYRVVIDPLPIVNDPGGGHCDTLGGVTVTPSPPNAPLCIEPGRKEPNTPPTPQGGGGEAPPPFDPLSVPMPTSLDNPSFRAAWSDWIKYRRSRRLSTREETVVKQFEFLAAQGERGALAVIEQSIRNGWQGLFPIGSRQGKPKLSEAEANEVMLKAMREAEASRNGENT